MPKMLYFVVCDNKRKEEKGDGWKMLKQTSIRADRVKLCISSSTYNGSASAQILVPG